MEAISQSVSRLQARKETAARAAPRIANAKYTSTVKRGCKHLGNPVSRYVTVNVFGPESPHLLLVCVCGCDIEAALDYLEIFAPPRPFRNEPRPLSSAPVENDRSHSLDARSLVRRGDEATSDLPNARYCAEALLTDALERFLEVPHLRSPDALRRQQRTHAAGR
jgi:hypothetical protein